MLTFPVGQTIVRSTVDTPGWIRFYEIAAHILGILVLALTLEARAYGTSSFLTVVVGDRQRLPPNPDRLLVTARHHEKRARWDFTAASSLDGLARVIARASRLQ